MFGFWYHFYISYSQQLDIKQKFIKPHTSTGHETYQLDTNLILTFSSGYCEVLCADLWTYYIPSTYALRWSILKYIVINNEGYY